MTRRFWFEFEIDGVSKLPPGLIMGCGITAFSLNDAIAIMDEKIFFEVKRPPFKKIVEDVDIRNLDQNHVIPNMKPPIYRGVWFPLGYD